MIYHLLNSYTELLSEFPFKCSHGTTQHACPHRKLVACTAVMFSSMLQQRRLLSWSTVIMLLCAVVLKGPDHLPESVARHIAANCTPPDIYNKCLIRCCSTLHAVEELFLQQKIVRAHVSPIVCHASHCMLSSIASRSTLRGATKGLRLRETCREFHAIMYTVLFSFVISSTP